MPAKKKPQFLRARQGFIGPDREVVKGGQVVAADHPSVKGREHLFEPLDETVEQATAAPGELRALSSKKAREAVVAAADAEPDDGDVDDDQGDR